jgi:hypothetical protein
MPVSADGPLAPSDDKTLWVPWEQQEKARAPWVAKDHFGKTVAPLKDQKTNSEIANEEVLQPRDEPVGNSQAFPIRGREHGSTLQAPRLNTESSKTGINL